MTSRLSFFTFEPLREVPELCSLCTSSSTVLIYESQLHQESGEIEGARGFCCGLCAMDLVKQLEGAESQQWMEKEAALKADDADIGDFQMHRLAAFRRTN